MIVETKLGPIGTGYDFEGVRKDGREFVGEIVKIIQTNNGTLVTVKQNTNDGAEYKNIYLEECRDWSAAQSV